MPIKNATRHTVLAVRSRVADSFLTRSVGLMFSKPQDAAMVLKFRDEQKVQLHMAFVFYPIDVIFVNKNHAIVDIKEHFKPFQKYTARVKAKYAIELPDGTVKATKTRVGDSISFLHLREKANAHGKSITVMKAGK